MFPLGQCFFETSLLKHELGLYIQTQIVFRRQMGFNPPQQPTIPANALGSTHPKQNPTPFRIFPPKTSEKGARNLINFSTTFPDRYQSV